ncbi:MAG: DUF3426 domain-containing protein [Rhizomicrobium sp.]
MWTSGFEPCGGPPGRLFSARGPIATGMILTCPECSTRYQADEAKFPPAGRDVRCAKCGHVWHQKPLGPETEASAFIAEPEPDVVSRSYEAPQSFVREPVVESEQEDPEAPESRSSWPGRLVLAAGWAGLVVLVLTVAWAATAYRQEVVAALPQSASFYAKIGMPTNASGLQIDNQSYHVESQDNQDVLVVTGRIVNFSNRELPVPQIRVTLTDNDKRELYHWSFVPDVLTLRPGQANEFSTRLSSPPAAARHLEMRFAQAGE